MSTSSNLLNNNNDNHKSSSIHNIVQASPTSQHQKPSPSSAPRRSSWVNRWLAIRVDNDVSFRRRWVVLTPIQIEIYLTDRGCELSASQQQHHQQQQNQVAIAVLPLSTLRLGRLPSQILSASHNSTNSCSSSCSSSSSPPLINHFGCGGQLANSFILYSALSVPSSSSSSSSSSSPSSPPFSNSDSCKIAAAGIDSSMVTASSLHNQNHQLHYRKFVFKCADAVEFDEVLNAITDLEIEFYTAPPPASKKPRASSVASGTDRRLIEHQQQHQREGVSSVPPPPHHPLPVVGGSSRQKATQNQATNTELFVAPPNDEAVKKCENLLAQRDRDLLAATAMVQQAQHELRALQDEISHKVEKLSTAESTNEKLSELNSTLNDADTKMRGEISRRDEEISIALSKNEKFAERVASLAAENKNLNSSNANQQCRLTDLVKKQEIEISRKDEEISRSLDESKLLAHEVACLRERLSSTTTSLVAENNNLKCEVDRLTRQLNESKHLLVETARKHLRQEQERQPQVSDKQTQVNAFWSSSTATTVDVNAGGAKDDENDDDCFGYFAPTRQHVVSTLRNQQQQHPQDKEQSKSEMTTEAEISAFRRLLHDIAQRCHLLGPGSNEGTTNELNVAHSSAQKLAAIIDASCRANDREAQLEAATSTVLPSERNESSLATNINASAASARSPADTCDGSRSPLPHQPNFRSLLPRHTITTHHQQRRDPAATISCAGPTSQTSGTSSPSRAAEATSSSSTPTSASTSTAATSSWSTPTRHAPPPSATSLEQILVAVSQLPSAYESMKEQIDSHEIDEAAPPRSPRPPNHRASECFNELIAVLATLHNLLKHRNRNWLHHHLCAESIARFALALKRAGRILRKVKGCAAFADEFEASWRIAEQLITLPRYLVEEDHVWVMLHRVICQGVVAATKSY